MLPFTGKRVNVTSDHSFGPVCLLLSLHYSMSLTTRVLVSVLEKMGRSCFSMPGEIGFKLLTTAFVSWHS